MASNGSPSPQPDKRDGKRDAAEAAGSGDRVLTLRDSALGELTAHPADHRTMPADFSISLAAKGPTDRLLMRGAGGPRLQPMR